MASDWLGDDIQEKIALRLRNQETFKLRPNVTRELRLQTSRGIGADITPAAVICCHKYCQDERVAMERSGNVGLGSELDI